MEARKMDIATSISIVRGFWEQADEAVGPRNVTKVDVRRNIKSERTPSALQ
jgi:hypothetical protein